MSESIPQVLPLEAARAAISHTPLVLFVAATIDRIKGYGHDFPMPVLNTCPGFEHVGEAAIAHIAQPPRRAPDFQRDAAALFAQVDAARETDAAKQRAYDMAQRQADWIDALKPRVLTVESAAFLPDGILPPGQGITALGEFDPSGAPISTVERGLPTWPGHVARALGVHGGQLGTTAMLGKQASVAADPSSIASGHPSPIA